MPCNLLKDNRHFGGTCHLPLQGRRISQARNKRDALHATCFHTGFLRGLFYPEDGGDMFLRNVGWFFNGLHGIVFQKIELFKTVVVRSSNPNKYNVTWSISNYQCFHHWKAEAAHYFETSLKICETTRWHIHESMNLHSENLRSRTFEVQCGRLSQSCQPVFIFSHINP
jgi:hypothetical protein